MNVLISTEPDDVHAILTKLALEEKSHQCSLWFTADMPTKQTNSIFFSNEQQAWLLENESQQPLTNHHDIDIVWWRRARRPFIGNNFAKGDQEFIRKENTFFHDGIPLVLANDAFWINPYDAISRANSKLFQLKLALQCGFKIPPTLISNSPERIKYFLNQYEHEQAVYKPLSAHHWYEKDVLRMFYTKTICKEQLPSNEILQLTPGIFQKYIKKKYELRITCFGTHSVAAKIASQEHPQGLNDWRYIPPLELKVEPYKLPYSLEKKIQNFMDALGIVFGCFDFIVTPEGDYYFLEVNQQGQFLWIEDCCPTIKMLDKFVKFILNRDAYFNWKDKETISLADYEEKAAVVVYENMQKHIMLNALKKTEAA
ncbi:Glutathione synthase/Ribosomal protein S6 modification enzyme (glutaminyl transferase) [Legionella beliardensis]|uniref:Glutathione synthase/Ribosomal protein S6 modification enzyme (Glutaminyl transferase) n=1 Tax=Legionella beliardensis TaxID=91822 RepID=A0A378I3C4_9GAMM|nr:hypothetical protein [Legionella beliardensis]STX29679.1 Glutathione synthase/Ribosomal protein S6 modification enzyme (glutaminyl transferase) [Legionella beliardensis]